MIMAGVAYNLKKYLKYKDNQVVSMAQSIRHTFLITISFIWLILRPYKQMDFEYIQN